MESIDLKEFRKRNKITQKGLADFFEVGQGFISQIENGQRPIPRNFIERLLANNCNWDTADLHESSTLDMSSHVQSLTNIIESQQETIRSQAKIIEQQGATIQQLIDQQKEAARRDCPAGCAGVAGA